MQNSNFESHSVADEQSKNEEYPENSTSEKTTGELRDVTTPSPTNHLDVENEMPEEISSESTEEEIPDIQLSPVVEEISGEVKI